MSSQVYRLLHYSGHQQRNRLEACLRTCPKGLKESGVSFLIGNLTVVDLTLLLLLAAASLAAVFMALSRTIS